MSAACEGFRWIGQSFASCDRCGLPFWEHSHEERLPADTGSFSPDPMELVRITAEKASACRRKWEAGVASLLDTP